MVEEKLGHQCRQCCKETDQALTIFAGEDRDVRQLLLQRENNNLRIVRALCDLEQQAFKEETDTLKVVIAPKEQKRADLLQQ